MDRFLYLILGAISDVIEWISQNNERIEYLEKRIESINKDNNEITNKINNYKADNEKKYEIDIALLLFNMETNEYQIKRYLREIKNLKDRNKNYIDNIKEMKQYLINKYPAYTQLLRFLEAFIEVTCNMFNLNPGLIQ